MFLIVEYISANELFIRDYDTNNIVTPVRVGVLQHLLEQACYPPAKIEFLIRGFVDGFDIHYEGKTDVKLLSNNLPLRCGTQQDLWTKIIKEVKLDRVVGPFAQIPHDSCGQSPVGLVNKQNSDTRVIFHLLYPLNSHEPKSVNDNTPKELCSTQYKDLDNAIQLCVQAGKGCYLAKSDMESAFRHLLIRPLVREKMAHYESCASDNRRSLVFCGKVYGFWSQPVLCTFPGSI